MNCYLVEGGGKKKYVGTMADVTTMKKELLASGLRRRDITVTDIEVPDDKQGKLDFINSLLNPLGS